MYRIKLLVLTMLVVLTACNSDPARDVSMREAAAMGATNSTLVVTIGNRTYIPAPAPGLYDRDAQGVFLLRVLTAWEKTHPQLIVKDWKPGNDGRSLWIEHSPRPKPAPVHSTVEVRKPVTPAKSEDCGCIKR